jgi:hypothetical protein
MGVWFKFCLFGSNFVVFAQILVCRVGDIKYCCVGSNFGVSCWLNEILLCWLYVGSNFWCVLKEICFLPFILVWIETFF